MNKYLVYVTGGKDSLGFNFISNVVAMANKGAVLQEDKIPNMRFPHSAWMYYETEEFMEDSPGFQFQIIAERFTKEQLDEMEWAQVRSIAKKVGVTGRDRQQVTRQYLEKIAEE